MESVERHSEVYPDCQRSQNTDNVATCGPHPRLFNRPLGVNLRQLSPVPLRVVLYLLPIGQRRLQTLLRGLASSLRLLTIASSTLAILNKAQLRPQLGGQRGSSGGGVDGGRVAAGVGKPRE